MQWGFVVTCLALAEACRMNKQNAQVVIVGGGMVGAATACGLADLGLTVTLIERNKPDFDWQPGDIDLRVSAINRASRHLLENLGAWQFMPIDAVIPYREMRVWDKPDGDIHFDSADIGEPDLGHIIQNRVIQRALWRAMQQRDSITIMSPASVELLEQRPSGIALQLDEGRNVFTNLLVAADGANSQMRDMLGITVSEHDFRQHAVVATVRLANGHKETAWQRFLPSGPLAFLPISHDQCSIVWSTTETMSTELIGMTDDEFCLALSNAVDGCLGTITATSSRARFPLRSMHADRYITANAALVGDAAHQIHPLAGQGVNLGFRDAGALVDTIAALIGKGRPLGNLQGLRTYERSRRGDNLLMQKSMEGFNRLFSNQNVMLKLVRNSGLTLTNQLPMAKQIFMQHALGTDGDIPTLCQPRHD